MASPAYEIVERVLTKNAKATFEDVKKAAARKGVTVAPVVYGLAKKNLGLTTPKTPAAKKAKASRKPSASRQTERVSVRGSRRSAPAISSTSLDGLGAIVERVQQLEADRERKNQALVEIQRVIEAALAD